MTITKQLESEVKQFLDNYWQTYFEGDLQKWSTFISDDYKNIGGTEEEIWNSKEEIMDYTSLIINQMVGAAEIRNKQTQVFSLAPFVLAHEFCDMYIKVENAWVFYGKFRLSSILKQSKTGWQVIHQHGSYPDSKTEQGEAFAFDKISKENRELKEAIKRRTVELENKTRDLEIEASLERVRTVAMSMHKPDDMLDVCRMIASQLQQLGFEEIRNVQTVVIYEQKHEYLNYQYFTPYDQISIERIDYLLHPDVKEFTETMLQSPDAYYTKTFEGNELNVWRQYRKQTNQLPDPKLDDTTSSHYYFYSIGAGALGVTTYAPLRQDQIVLFRHFRNAFQLAYSRFKDIQQAEEQAREAQIEAALERVRSRTMAMQKSSELAETSFVLFQQFQALGETSKQISIGIFKEEENIMELYSTLYGSQWREPVNLDLDEPVVVRKIYAAWKEQRKSLLIDISGEDLLKYNAYRKKLSNIDYKEDRWVIHIAFFSKGVITFSVTEPHPHETIQLLERFAQVFDQTYTRFLDLQQAETQTREALIENALEKVRSQTMGMQTSEDLAKVAAAMFDQIRLLGGDLFSCGIVLCAENKNEVDQWLSVPGIGMLPPFFVPKNLDFIHQYRYDQWKAGVELFSIEIPGDKIAQHFEKLYALPSLKNITDRAAAQGMALPETPKWEIDYGASFTYGYLLISALQPFKETHIFTRFAKVFDQTYTRFLDLQKAEAQAREAQIEAALERVRSRTMAMQKSEELKEVIQVVYDQLVHLNLLVEHTGFIMDYKTRDTMHIWLADKHEVPFQVTIPYFDSPHWNSFIVAKEKGIDFFANHLSFKEKNKFYKALFKFFPVPDEAKEYYFNCPGLAISTVLLENVGLYIENFSGIPYTEEENKTLMRFGIVFQQTYTRFLDLQKAESQAREAQIEAALERVRSRTLAMQKSEELAETAAVLFKQLINLGIEPTRLYINIIKDENGISEFWITDEDGTKVSSAFESNMNENPTFKRMFEGWREKRKTLTIDMKGIELKKYLHHLQSLHVPFKDGLMQKRRLQYIAYFNKGFIGMASPDEQPEETINLLERFAAVFNLTFTRFNDLKIAEAHALQAAEDLVKLQTEKKRVEVALGELQLTQKQLIQSEKMASLGELTAGIAHEIQNPLNFVNNFSEVNAELIEELKSEKLKPKRDRDAQVEESLFNDIVSNLEKINHHGKRADAIVKGMLQHSRSSSGRKEPVYINQLVDEYLRLAYHGLRAKDKSFNAILNTDYDQTIGKVNIIPQDIGRVILNLITNAFYAVTEKKNLGIENYEPIVSLSTVRGENEIMIRVKDNGNGIPKKIADKIFQPFFTTKPTGQGTGLGLSLSYDIVKAHMGELKVKTKEGDGTEFTIALPV